MKKCKGRRLDNIGPFSATETSVLMKFYKAYYLIFLISWQIMNQQTYLNINSLTILLLNPFVILLS